MINLANVNKIWTEKKYSTRCCLLELRAPTDTDHSLNRCCGYSLPSKKEKKQSEVGRNEELCAESSETQESPPGSTTLCEPHATFEENEDYLIPRKIECESTHDHYHNWRAFVHTIEEWKKCFFFFTIHTHDNAIELASRCNRKCIFFT